MKDNKLIIGIGECLFDSFADGTKELGGAPANFAYHAGQLMGMENALLISACGDDTNGTILEEELDKRGLQRIMPVIPDHPTGIVDVLPGPSYVINEGVAYDVIPFTSEMEAVARKAAVVCFGSLAQRNEVSRETILRFLDASPSDCIKVFDINIRQHYYSREIIERSLQKCNILKLNEDELPEVCRMFGIKSAIPEERCRRIMSLWHIDTVIFTCGAIGSYVFTPNETSYMDSPKVQVANTVGAGDSFTATYCCGLLLGKDICEAHRLAAEVSAFVCTKPGAMPTIPEELRKQFKKF